MAFVLTGHQQQIFDTVVDEILLGLNGNDNYSIVNLNGFAGSGKSVLTTEIIKYFSKYRRLAVTPTHKSLKVLSDLLKENECKGVQLKTIHSFLKLKLDDNHETGLKELVPNLWGDDTESIDILVVDEKSMCSDELLSYAVEKIELGMIKVILLVGDLYQLLPVDTGELSAFIKNNTENTLTEPLRYALDNPILSTSFNIKNIIDSKEYLPNLVDLLDQLNVVHTRKEFMTRYFVDDSIPEERIVINYTNKHVNRYNDYIRNLIKDKPEDSIIVGDKLIFNDTYYKNKNTEFVHLNSEICEVASCVKIYDKSHDISYWNIIDTDNKSFPVIDFPDLDKFKKRLNRLADLAKGTKDINERKKKWGHFFSVKNKYADVSYTYSCTAHKAQGSSYESVFIDLTDFDKPYYPQDVVYRLLYVAITRSRDKVTILA